MVAVAALPFHLISVFVLATPNNYWTRMVPISDTWGHHFVHMYYMMARSGAFTRGLKKKCKKWESFETLDRYVCDTGANPDPNNLNQQRHPLSLLYASTCTDKKFGASPTCKLEQAMLYFL